MAEEEHKYAMGKNAATSDQILFSFLDYFSKPDLPTPPPVFGVWQHFWNIKMFQNNRIGDCVFAGAANETASWHRDVGKWVEFMDEGVLSDYSAATGYVPGDKSTDKGADMAKAAEYRRKTGIIDRYGRRHKIDAYVKLEKGNFDDLRMAMYLFGGVGLGFLMPDWTQKDFDKGIPWADKNYRKIIGGHYVPGVGIDGNGDIVIVTWGKYHRVTKEFYEKFSDEACAMFSLERTLGRTSPEGFKVENLVKDLKSLKAAFGYSNFNFSLDKAPEPTQET